MSDIHTAQFLIIPFVIYIWARMNVKSKLKKNNVPFSNTLHFKNYKSCRLQANTVDHEETKIELTNAANYYIWSLLFMMISFVGVILIMVENK